MTQFCREKNTEWATGASAMASLLLAAALVACAVHHAAACGMTTHDTVAHQAAALYFTDAFNGTFEAMVKSNPSALQGGAPFPDYLYTCGNNHSAGEAAHWTPFQASAIAFINTLPTPWDTATQQLVVFMHGVVSHYIADMSWHGLNTPTGYGFIESLGIADYNCTGNLCSVAHTAADTGGEFVAAAFANLTFAAPVQWYIPTTDLVSIFKLRGFTVTPQSIEQCHALFAGGELAVKTLASLVYDMVTAPSAFLQEQYFTAAFGGIEDMAVWTGRMWCRFEDWLMNGVPPGPPPRVLRCAHTRRPHAQLVAALGHHFQDLVHVRAARHGRGVHVTASPTESAVMAARLRKVLATHADVRDAVTGVLGTRVVDGLLHGWQGGAAAPLVPPTPRLGAPPAPSMQWVSTLPSAYVGASIASGDFNGDGGMDVAFGGWGAGDASHPNRGAVWLAVGGNTTTVDGLPAARVLPPTAPIANFSHPSTYARFGHTVATVDLNLDGVDDLAVAAPASGWNWTAVSLSPDFHYFGAVFVYFGRRRSPPFAATPDATITGTARMTMLGSSLSAVDVNGDGHADLVMGAPMSVGNPLSASSSPSDSSPHRGALYAVVASPHVASGTVLADTQCDVAMFGPDPLAAFGAAVAGVAADDRQPALVVVSSPTWRDVNRSDITVGQVSAYVAAAGRVLTRAWSVAGDVQHSRFGASVSAGAGGLLAVGAPGGGTAPGAVYVFNVSAAAPGHAPPQVTMLPGVHAGDRFGSWVLVRSGTVLVAAPLLAGTHALQRNVGGVFTVSLTASDTVPSAVAVGTVAGERLGTAVAVVEDGAGGATLFLGAPHRDSGGVEHAGGVGSMRYHM